MARKIRLLYSGLVAFASKIFSVFTGMVFVTMVTRKVSESDFGVWQWITLIISYITFANCIMNYWVTRYMARGLKTAKTGLTTSLTFSLIGFIVLFLISPFAAKIVNTEPVYFMIGSFLVPAMYLVSSLEAIAQGSVPHVTGYGFVVFEITKVALGLITVFFMNMGLYGVIASILVAHLVRAVVLLVSLRDYVTEGSFDWNAAKKWLKTGWIPLYSGLALLLPTFDRFIVTLLTQSPRPISLWGAASTIVTVVGYSTVLAYALYPKLLSGGSGKDVETSLKLVLMLAVPLVIGALLLAEPLLQILKHDVYAVAAPILQVSTLFVFLTSIGMIFSSVVIGTEKIDTEDASFRRLLKSRLFLVPTIYYVKMLAYLPLVYLVTTTIVNLHLEPVHVNIPFYCNLTMLLLSIPTLTYMYILAKRVLPFKFPIKSLAKYVAASMALLVIIIPFYPRGFARTITSIAISTVAYLLVLYAIDKDTRDLINQIISTIKQ